MLLREIYIDGFGIICNTRITGISSGTSVIYGPNEFGKSTLLEFIRRMLFGFRGTNPYPTLSGGSYGGRIVCELANGKVITVSRKEGRSGGVVKISGDFGDFSGQEELNRILGLTTQRFYENIYAIGLDDLQTIRTLEEEEIKNHIYGAGLGLGNTSLKEIKDTFSKQAEAIFKSGGSVQLMPALYKDIRAKEKVIGEAKKQLSEYDEVVRQYDELQEEIKSLGIEIGELEADQRRLQAQQKLFPPYVNLKEKESQLLETPQTPLFLEDSLTTLGKLETSCSNLEKQTNRDNSDLKELEQTRDHLVYDDAIIEVEPSVISLQKKSEQYKSASKDITSVRSQRATLADSIKAKVQRLGPEWTEERVIRFNFNLLQEDQSRTAREEINQAKRSIENIRSKLEAYQDSKAAESAKGIHFPVFIKNAGYVSTILGIAGIILGFFLSQPLLSGFSACLLIFGLIVAANARRAGKNPVSDPLEKKYAGDLSTAESTYAGVSGEWQRHLREVGFDEKLSPDGALDVIRTVREIKSDLGSLKERDSRIEAMQSIIETVGNLLIQVIQSLGKTKISDDTIANIEILTQQLATAKETKSKRESLDERLIELTRKVRIDEDAANRAKEDLRQYLQNFDAKDEAEFRIKYNTFRKRETLKKAIDESKIIIQSTVGIGEEYEHFMASISSTNPEAIATSLDTVASKLEELKTLRDQKNQAVGELRNQIQALSSKDLIAEQTELETKKQRLRDCSADWVRAQIALFVLEKAISRYENTRQPEVIKAATEVFAKITHHAYSMVVKRAETDPGKTAELSVQDNSARRKTISEMSRGTKEQLYLAMRLGLISVYETKSEPMPIIMDDILANFDDSRGPEAIKALIEFSNGRQLIVLTCHKSSFDLYKSLGAQEIRLASAKA